MANKLKAMKLDLKKWNNEECRKVEVKKEKLWLWDDLTKLDTLEKVINLHKMIREGLDSIRA